MADVTGYRIVALQTRIADVLNQTSDDSTLPKKEQVRLLADSCEQACGLLGDWLADPSLEQLRPSKDVLVKDLIPDRATFDEFLGATLRDALKQASGYGMTIDYEQVERARKAILATVRKKPRAKSTELFATAVKRVSGLQKDVCELARHLQGSQSDSAVLRKARRVLKAVIGLLPALVIGMAGVGPSQVSHNFADWGHETVKVVAIHHIAHSAEPSLGVTMSHQGPVPG